MKVKIISIFICMLMCTTLFLCTGCSSSQNEDTVVKQTAEAWLSEGDIRTAARVDLSGGWSVEFASGAVYLYDKEITPNTETAAMCITLEEEVYNEYLEKAKASDTYKETDDYIYYEDTEMNECIYLYKLGKAYFLISVKDKENADNIISRFSLIPEESYY